MRRLLNRVHDLLYARNNGVASDIYQFPSVVAELDHQLEKWKDLLPPPFQFTEDREPAKSTEAGFLRQRYLTCKSVIYRPYLTWALSLTTRGETASPAVYEGCKTCLQACCLHAENLHGFPQTIMIDTWICSLSYVHRPSTHLTHVDFFIGWHRLCLLPWRLQERLLCVSVFQQM